MTRHADHKRIRTFREVEGRGRTTGHTSAGRGMSRSRRSGSPADADLDQTSPDEPAGRFEPPAIDVELDFQSTARKRELWVHLRGEADLANHEQLHRGLTRAELDRADEVHLVLDELTFCDLYAFRQLVGFAGEVRARGRQIFSHGACPTLKKIARLMNVAQDLHFV